MVKIILEVGPWKNGFLIESLIFRIANDKDIKVSFPKNVSNRNYRLRFVRKKKLKNVILTEFSIFRITCSKNKNKDYQNNVDDYENNFGTIYKLVKHWF